MDELVGRLARFGLSPYESKALLALFKRHPANGYEVGKAAGIPTSKIYGTLERLVSKGIVVAERAGSHSRFNPVPLPDLIGRLRADYRVAIDELEAELVQLRAAADLDLSWNLEGTDEVLLKARELIRGASRELILSLWRAEHARLAPEIRDARRRGVKTVLALFGARRSGDAFTIAMNGCGPTSLNRLKCRLSIAVADGRQVLIAEVRDEASASRGVWTMTRGVVLVASEYVRHDIWGRVLIDELGEARFRQICGSNPVLSYLITHQQEVSR